ncbi:hypothetical protein A2368_03655 [Candidatus Collierbacteria bacterium RIFOXYB1_FULL_49_13]|uniref:Uncharacterized protein n=1 Tax=Candidatus Collierbacteria bacterium RIFOXYB1_FULL_49_13 TaxID=1817728 RepID=A0A1F5FKP6_9BACT|nr:MAG: hypothetical protein A2368_03655 [Candidatus Collierbacteria bacterium RIFOXYB1_FULL_49_13]
MTKLKKSNTKDVEDFFFDDCPICQAMKKAAKEGRSLSESELRAAFAEAEKTGKGKVGRM